MTNGNSSNFHNGLNSGVSVAGAFKLDLLHPFEPTLFRHLPTFLFHTGGPFLMPQRAINEEREFSLMNET